MKIVLRWPKIDEDSKMILTPILIILRIILEPALFYLFSSHMEQKIPIEILLCFQSLLYAIEFLNIFDRFKHKITKFNITQKFPFLLSLYILVWVIFHQIIIKEIFVLDTLLPLYLLIWAYINFLLSLWGCFWKEIYETEKFSFKLYAIFILILIISEVYSDGRWIFHGVFSIFLGYVIWGVIITGATGISAQFSQIFLSHVSSVHDFIKFSKNFLDNWLLSDIKGLARLFNSVLHLIFNFNWIVLGFYDKTVFKHIYLFEMSFTILSFPLGYLLMIRHGFSHNRHNAYVGMNAFAMIFVFEIINYSSSLIFNVIGLII